VNCVPITEQAIYSFGQRVSKPEVVDDEEKPSSATSHTISAIGRGRNQQNPGKNQTENG
jgi:hypothetical protein